MLERLINLQLFAEETPPAADGQQPGKTFTQAELDLIVSDRLKRERDKFKDFDAHKKAAEELQALRTAQLSDTEKLQKQLADLEADKQKALSTANDRLLRAEVKSIAADLGCVDAEAALALMGKTGVSVEADGTVKGVKEALEALLAAKPYLKTATQNKGGTDFGGGNPGGKDPSKMTQPEYEAWRKKK